MLHKLIQNGCVESLNGRMRVELLNQTLFFDLADAHAEIAAYAAGDCDHNRPHSALGYLIRPLRGQLHCGRSAPRPPTSFPDRLVLHSLPVMPETFDEVATPTAKDEEVTAARILSQRLLDQKG